MTLLLSQAGYGRRLGVTAAAISQWKKAGMLVMRGAQVDAEASDERLKRCRTRGLPSIRPQGKIVKQGRPGANARLLHAEPVQVRLPCAEVLRRLTELDWTQTFDWTDAAQDQRARLAAICVGLTACTSPLRDDGHWGGYQLRYSTDAADALNHDDIAAGFGFECDLWDVLARCRAELEPPGGDDEVAVCVDLLHLLGHPFGQHDQRR